jgi:hypothetical protein
MAPNHRSRPARRFGEPITLADQAQVWPCDRPPPRADGRPVDPDAIPKMARSAACILGDDVLAEYDRCRRDVWQWTDLPALRLPFRRVLVECPFPFCGSGSRLGAFLATGPDAAVVLTKFRPLFTSDDYLTSGSIPFDQISAQYREAVHTLAFREVLSLADRRRVIPVDAGVIFLDGHHVPLGPPIGEVRHDLADRLRLPPEGWDRLMNGLFPLALTLGFMSCQNVATTVVEPSRALNAQRRTANLPPLVTYHRILVGPLERVIVARDQQPDEDVDGDPDGRPLHVVRGHFARFEADRPMFGQPGLHGDFWIAPHFRGDIRNGVVESDYWVVPPPGDN